MMFQKLYKSFFFSGATTIISYSLTIFLTYRFIPEEYGRYLLALAWAAFLSVIIDFSTSYVFTHYANTRLQVNEAIFTVLGVRLAFLILVFLLLFLLEIISFDLPIITLFFIFTAFNLGFLFEYYRENVRFAAIIFFEKSFFVSSVFIALNFGSSIYILCILYFLSSIISLIYQFYFFRNVINRKVLFRVREILFYIRKYFPFFIISMSQLSYGISSRLLLEKKLGVEIFVFFSLSLQVVALASIFQSQADRIFRREIVGLINDNGIKEIRILILKYVFYYVLPMACVALLVGNFAQFPITWILDDSYLPVADYLACLSPVFITVPIIRLIDHFMLALDKFNVNLWLNVLISVGLLSSLAVLHLDPAFNFGYIISLWQVAHSCLGGIFVYHILRKKHDILG